jgi:phosphoserine phosphatase
MNPEIKVISFDLDGVLFDGRSATYPVAKAVGLEQEFVRVLDLSSEKQLTLEEAIREGSKIWVGVPTDGTLDPYVNELPLRVGSEATISYLKEWGYKVGCISSGVSQFFLKPLTRRLNLDFAFSNVLGEKDGRHDGSVSYVMTGPNKAATARKYLEQAGLVGRNLASIGDGENDIPLFRISGFSIAFNPDSDAVSSEASITINSNDLRAVLPHFIPDF